MKNSLKIILLSLGASLGLLPALRADDTPPPPANQAPAPEGPGQGGGGNRGEKMLERMAKALNLTPDQESKWQALGQQEHEAVQALRADTSVPKDQRRPKMEEIRKNFEGQRRAILTPDQQTKFDELIAKMRERWKDHGGQGQGQGQGQSGPPPPPPAPDNK